MSLLSESLEAQEKLREYVVSELSKKNVDLTPKGNEFKLDISERTLNMIARSMAKKIAKKAPIAVKYSKEAINRGMQTDLDSAIAIEANLFGLCFSTEDQKEGMAAFLEKREAVYKNK
jgi:enoyl-CoA hydratase/carnithine racemase